MRRSHGGQDAQRPLVQRGLRGIRQGVAIGVVLYHRAARPYVGGGPEFRSGIPTQLTSWKEKGLSWGSSVELDGLQKCIWSMASEKLKLVNIVQVMLIRRILPCQQRDFNLWEFDPAWHQTLSELFDTTHKDVWKVLFKGAEVPPPRTADSARSALPIR